MVWSLTRRRPLSSLYVFGVSPQTGESLRLCHLTLPSSLSCVQADYIISQVARFNLGSFAYLQVVGPSALQNPFGVSVYGDSILVVRNILVLAHISGIPTNRGSSDAGRGYERAGYICRLYDNYSDAHNDPDVDAERFRLFVDLPDWFLESDAYAERLRLHVDLPVWFPESDENAERLHVCIHVKYENAERDANADDFTNTIAVPYRDDNTDPLLQRY